MISRKLLIIHDSRVIRNILKGYILAELDDISVVEASTGAESEHMVEEDKIDIILCADFLKDCDGHELLSILQLSEKGMNIPFIIFTSTTTTEHISELKARGVQHFLVTPFTSEKLRDKIDEVFDPRQLRVQQRYSIPGTQAMIHSENQNITADVINLSMSSVFCEFILPAGSNDLLNSMYISIRFPAEFGDALISDIYCKLLSIKTISWLPNDLPEKIRVVWLLKNLSQRNESVIANILSRVEKKNKSLANI